MLCVLALSGAIAAWQLYVLGLVQGVAVALDAPARHTLVFRIVGPEDITNAVGLSSSLGTTARIVGPALGGLVVASFGPGVAFGLNAISYGIVICALLAIRLAPRPPRDEPLPSVLAGVGEALRFAVSSRRVAVTFFTVLLVSTFAFNFDVLLPLLAKLTLDSGPGTFGLIASVFGGGALCGALDPRDGREGEDDARAGRRARVRDLTAPARAAGRPARRCARCSSSRGSSTSSGDRARSRPSCSPRPTTCAGARRASTSSPSWAAPRSAVSSRAR